MWLWSSEDDAEHLLRGVARSRAVGAASKTRNDVDGIEAIDVDASSKKTMDSFPGRVELERH